MRSTFLSTHLLSRTERCPSKVRILQSPRDRESSQLSKNSCHFYRLLSWTLNCCQGLLWFPEVGELCLTNCSFVPPEKVWSLVKYNGVSI